MVQLKITGTIVVPAMLGKPAMVLLGQNFIPAFIISNTINVLFPFFNRRHGVQYNFFLLQFCG